VKPGSGIVVDLRRELEAMTHDPLVRIGGVFLVFAVISALTGAASASPLPGALAAVAGLLAITMLGLASALRERRRRPATVHLPPDRRR